MAYLPKRSPIEQVRCKSLSHAQSVAEQKRAAGYDAKATSRRVGSRRNPGREFTCFVYAKLNTGGPYAVEDHRSARPTRFNGDDS
jgi:hypothetical protein